MKKLASIVLSIILFCSYALGQDDALQRTPADEAAKQTAMLERRLQLTEQQVDTVYKIHLFYANRRREMSERLEHRQLFEQMIHELKGVLTPEQIKKLEQMQIDSKNRRNGVFIQRTDSSMIKRNLPDSIQ